MTGRLGVGGRASATAAIALLVFGVSAILGTTVASAADVPYQDPYAIGSLTLCDKDLQPLTSGSLTERPFVWRAVSDTAAPSPYNNNGRRAVLYYVQPMKNVDPLDWSSEILTAPATYSDPGAPIAQATPIDFPLIAPVTNYPPQWEGMVQLRMYFTTEGQPQSADYVTADIRVEGDSWTLVQGGDADCDAGKAVSAELQLDDYEKRLRQAQNGTDLLSKEFDLEPVSSTSSPEGEGGSTSNPSGDDTNASSKDAAGNVEASSTAPSGDGSLLWVGIVAALAIFAGVGLAVTFLNRRS